MSVEKTFFLWNWKCDNFFSVSLSFFLLQLFPYFDCLSLLFSLCVFLPLSFCFSNTLSLFPSIYLFLLSHSLSMFLHLLLVCSLSLTIASLSLHGLVTYELCSQHSQFSYRRHAKQEEEGWMLRVQIPVPTRIFLVKFHFKVY